MGGKRAAESSSSRGKSEGSATITRSIPGASNRMSLQHLHTRSIVMQERKTYFETKKAASLCNYKM
eukprot:scaffold28924_cov66-Skeletonema_marinoi.AAC.1